MSEEIWMKRPDLFSADKLEAVLTADEKERGWWRVRYMTKEEFMLMYPPSEITVGQEDGYA